MKGLLMKYTLEFLEFSFKSVAVLRASASPREPLLRGSSLNLESRNAPATDL
jgi:hypothetical protein